MLQNYEDAKDARNWLARVEAALTVAQAVATAASGGISGVGVRGRYRLGSAVAVAAAATGHMRDRGQQSRNRRPDQRRAGQL